MMGSSRIADSSVRILNLRRCIHDPLHSNRRGFRPRRLRRFAFADRRGHSGWRSNLEGVPGKGKGGRAEGDEVPEVRLPVPLPQEVEEEGSLIGLPAPSAPPYLNKPTGDTSMTRMTQLAAALAIGALFLSPIVGATSADAAKKMTKEERAAMKAKEKDCKAQAKEQKLHLL